MEQNTGFIAYRRVDYCEAIPTSYLPHLLPLTVSGNFGHDQIFENDTAKLGTSLKEKTKFDINAPENSQFLEKSMRHAKYLAKSFCRSTPSDILYDDLLQIAYEGMLDAYSRFDPDMEGSSLNMVYARMRGSIQDYFRMNDPLSQCRRGNVTKVLNFKLNNHGASLEEIANGTNLNFKKVEIAIKDAEYRPIPFFDDKFYPSSLPTPDEVYGKKQDVELLRMAISELIESDDESVKRKIQAVQSYYFEDKTLVEIGGSFELTESRASQLVKAGEKLIKNRISRIMLMKNK